VCCSDERRQPCRDLREGSTIGIASDQSRLTQRVQTDGSLGADEDNDENDGDDRYRDTSECQPRSGGISGKFLARIFDRCWDRLDSNLDSLVARDSGDSGGDDDNAGQVDNTRARAPHFPVQLTISRDDELPANFYRLSGYLAAIGC